jgi:hypothetical protein|tara:strand:+ start:5850 stop:6062 length:213 start_codon:yes stop_codon:yes gene_type:complete
MTEKSVRQLERELAEARAKVYNARKVEVNRDLDAVGIDLSRTVEKKIPDSNDIPDVILMPKRKRNTENKW